MNLEDSLKKYIKTLRAVANAHIQSAKYTPHRPDQEGQIQKAFAMSDIATELEVLLIKVDNQ